MSLISNRSKSPPSSLLAIIIYRVFKIFTKPCVLLYHVPQSKMASVYISRQVKIAIAAGVVVVAVIAVIFGVKPLAHFSVDKVLCNPGEVALDYPVTVSAEVRNEGLMDGNYTAELSVQGEVVNTKSVAVSAKSQQTVSFRFIPTSAGEYEVKIGGAKATFIASEGIFPTWYNGDTWTYKVNTELGTSELTYLVQGEAIYENSNIYLVRVSGKILAGTSGQEVQFANDDFIKKETLSALEEERSGIINGAATVRRIVFDDEIVEGTQWPLKVGNTWKVRSNQTITTRSGILISSEIVNAVRNFSVDSMEDVTTDAGVFRCFKIVERDEQMNVVGTSWYADKLKREVKNELISEGTVYSYSLVAYKVATAAPPVVPEIKIQKSTEYNDAEFGYTIYYPDGWELKTREGQQGVIDLYTTAKDRGMSIASVTVVAIPGKGVADLDKVYNDIVAGIKSTDAQFKVLTSKKVAADLPWYDYTWGSSIKGDQAVPITGRTIIVVKNEMLYIVGGWVQEDYSKKFSPIMNRIINSFGISQ
jgi:hypothetical protein